MTTLPTCELRWTGSTPTRTAATGCWPSSALAWSWAGRHDDVLAYADRWLVNGTTPGHESAWAIAFTPCSMTLYCARWEAIHPHRQSVDALIDATGDGRAPLVNLALVRGRRRPGARASIGRSSLPPSQAPTRC